LQGEIGMAIMFITHNLGVIAQMADDVIVMYMGKVVETAPVQDIFHDAKHPYTQALLRSIPRLGSRSGQRLQVIKGVVPDPYAIPEGCPFNPRCALRMDICRTQEPPVLNVGDAHGTRCWLYK
jgi:peptide/nickel transport system ATP-binding protein